MCRLLYKQGYVDFREGFWAEQPIIKDEENRARSETFAARESCRIFAEGTFPEVLGTGRP